MAWTTPGPRLLLEREQELQELSAVSEAAVGGAGAVAAILGAPGIGKTSLTLRLREIADARGAFVGRATGTEMNASVAYHGARALLGELAASVEDDAVSPRAREALAHLHGEAGTANGVVMLGEGGRIMSFGLTELVLAVARRRPVALIVDDLQWIDSPTQRWLAFLARRLAGHAVLLGFAAREGDVEADDAFLADLVEQCGARVVRPSPLSVAATETLVRDALAGPEHVADLGRRCHDLVRGNPFLTWELIHELQENHDQMLGLGFSANALDRFADQVLTRVESVDAEALPVAEAITVLASPPRLDDIAALASVSVDAAAESIDALRRVGLLSGDDHGFSHPILRAALYDAVGRRRREELHEQAARRIDARGGDASAVAAHLLHARPGHLPDARATFVQAALQDLMRGAPETATRYLHRALREPATGEHEADEHVLALLASALWQGNDVGPASDALRRAIEQASDDEARLRLAVLRAVILGSTAAGADEAYETLSAVLARSGGRLSAESRLMGTATAALARLLTRPTDALLADVMAPSLPGTGDEERTMLAAQCWAGVLAMADRGRVVELGRSALGGGEPSVESFLMHGANWFAATGLLCAEDTPFVTGIAERYLPLVRARQGLYGTAGLLALRGLCDLLAGRFRRAADGAAEALDLFGLAASMGMVALAVRLEALVELDDIATAERELQAAPAPHDPPEQVLFTLFALRARGLVDEAAGRPREALDALTAVDRLADRLHTPLLGFMPWRLEAARVAFSVGDDEVAQSLVRRHLELARRWAAPGACAVAVAHARAAGVVAEVSGDAAGLPSFRQAEIEQAIANGARLGGDLREAREHMRVALTLLDADEHPRRHRLAEETLRAVGGRRSRSSADPLGLTVSQRRLAALLAEGLTNRQISELLVITPKSVENQLGRLYRRLGVRGRAEVVEMLEREPRDTAPA